MNSLYLLLMLAVVLFLPSYFMQRRQRAEAAKTSRMQDSLTVGDQVVLTSGLYGTIVEVDDTTVDVEIAEDVVTTWLRQAVREVRAPEAPAETETPAAETPAADAQSTGGETGEASGRETAPDTAPTATEHDKD